MSSAFTKLEYRGGGYITPSACDRQTLTNWVRSAKMRGVPMSESYAYRQLRHQRESHRISPITGMAALLKKHRSRKLSPSSWPSLYPEGLAIGIEIECFAASPFAVESLPYWVRRAGDGSIRQEDGTSGVEYRLLLRRDNMEERLFRFCDELQKSDHNVNKSCGLHVHFDRRGYDYTVLWLQTRRMVSWLRALQELVPLSRRSNGFCKISSSRTNRYRAVNFTAAQRHNTLEVRLHSGTIDFTKIVEWIRLLEAITQQTRGPKKGLTCLQVLATLPLTNNSLAYWVARHRKLNPKLYPATSAMSRFEVE